MAPKGVVLWIPADRFLAVTDAVGHRHSSLGKGSWIPRALNRLRSGEQGFISLEKADEILIRLGLEHHWHTRKEDGGLADIYEDGCQYGRPAFYDSPPPPRRKYSTHEDRLAARRAAYREKLGRAA